jgi:hypothetical protein
MGVPGGGGAGVEVALTEICGFEGLGAHPPVAGLAEGGGGSSSGPDEPPGRLRTAAIAGKTSSALWGKGVSLDEPPQAPSPKNATTTKAQRDAMGRQRSRRTAVDKPPTAPPGGKGARLRAR